MHTYNVQQCILLNNNVTFMRYIFVDTQSLLKSQITGACVRVKNMLGT